MAYDVYTLTGFVMEVAAYGEYDKRFVFLSEEYGLITVTAIGSAKPASKLRGFLTRFCLIDIDVVHGKTGYRLIRARSRDGGFLIYKKEAYFILSRFYKLIRSILPEGVRSPETFKSMLNLSEYLQKKLILPEKTNTVFYSFAIDLLFSMGYSNIKTKDLNESKLEKMYQEILDQNGISRMI